MYYTLMFLRFLGITALSIALLAVALLTRGYPLHPSDLFSRIEKSYLIASHKRITREKMTETLRAQNKSRDISEFFKVFKGKDHEYTVQTTIHPILQHDIKTTFKKAQIAYGAFVAIDPTTGKVLSMVSYGMKNQNLALRATFPAASIFKIVTASAAIESGKFKHDSLIPVLGSYHTLYKRNLFKSGALEPESSPRYARLISFADALAKSVNSVFGKIGIFGLGSDGIKKAARQFAFNREIPFELNVESSKSLVPEDEYGLAESASGFTKNNTISPLHGALIASAIANEGAMMQPTLIERLTNEQGQLAYEFEPHVFSHSTDEKTSEELKVMLNRTITNGTSRTSFSGIDKSTSLSNLFIGGKTGTLEGWDPRGRYDWFVGFADNGHKKLAVSALCIHGKYRGMKASKIARTAFETYFKILLASNDF